LRLCLRVVALEAKDEALRGKVEKSVGDAKELGHLKARMRELEDNEKEREKAMASGEIEELKKTLGDKLKAEKARVQVQLKAPRCMCLLVCVFVIAGDCDCDCDCECDCDY
jgi:hypothetical protein